MNDSAWLSLLEAAVVGVERKKDGALLRQATQVLFTRFPQRRPTTLGVELFPRVADVAERILRLSLTGDVQDDGFAVETSLRCLCATAADGERVHRVLSTHAMETLPARTLFWLSTLAGELAATSPEALGWLASKVQPEVRDDWYQLRAALVKLPLSAAGLRAASVVLAADSRQNPGTRWVQDDDGVPREVPHFKSWGLQVAGGTAFLLTDSQASRHLHWGYAHQDLRVALVRFATALVDDPMLLAAISGSEWPAAFWRELVECAVADPAFGRLVWDLSCSDELMRSAPAPTVALAKAVLTEGGERGGLLEAALEAQPGSFRPLYLCVDEALFGTVSLRDKAIEIRGGRPPRDPRDLEPSSADEVSYGEADPHWWLREKGIDIDANAEPVRLRDVAEGFWSTYLNDPPSVEAAAGILPVLSALAASARGTDDIPLKEMLCPALLRGCRPLLRLDDPSPIQIDICRDALRLGRQVVESGDDDFAEVACMLMHHVDALDDEHRVWLDWARGFDVLANFNFRIFLIVLFRFDSEWAWRELEAWSNGGPDEWFVRALWQFRRLRNDEVIELAIEVDVRWRTDDKNRASVGGLLAHAALVGRHTLALEWLNGLCGVAVLPASTVNGVLWWMRDHAWLSPDMRLREAARRWVPLFAANLRAKGAALAAHELLFHLSALLIRGSPGADASEGGGDGGLIRAWKGVIRDVAHAIPLNGYDVWQLLPVIRVWAVHDVAEAATALRVIAERSEAEHQSAAMMMEMGDVVAAVEAVAAHAAGQGAATKDILFVIERLIVTRHPNALRLVDHRLALARALSP
jgi:hypothetical protein